MPKGVLNIYAPVSLPPVQMHAAMERWFNHCYSRQLAQQAQQEDGMQVGHTSRHFTFLMLNQALKMLMPTGGSMDRIVTRQPTG